MVRSRVSEAGAAPQEMTRSFSARGWACCTAHTACHWAGTRKMPVTFSASSTSSSAAGSKAPSGWMTVGMPSVSPTSRLPMPAMWNSGTPMKPTSLLRSAPLV